MKHAMEKGSASGLQFSAGALFVLLSLPGGSRAYSTKSALPAVMGAAGSSRSTRRPDLETAAVRPEGAASRRGKTEVKRTPCARLRFRRSGLAEHLLIDAHSPQNGKLDAVRVADAFGMTMRELAQAVNRDPGGLKKQPTSDSLQEPLHSLEEIGVQLRDVFGDLEARRMSQRAPHPVLGDRAPIVYLLEGRPVAVRRLLTLAETGTST